MSSLARLSILVACAVIVGAATAAAAAAASSDSTAAGAHVYDEANARAIMDLCAGCHGDFGQGGGAGEYPRLAGLPADYIIQQMHKFRSGERQSVVMAPFADEREVPEGDLQDLARYLSEIELMTQMPPIDPDLDSYEKLLIASRVFNVARIEGDHARGKALYLRDCADCHGPVARGQDQVPFLTGQFTAYIRQQIEEFRSGRRQDQAMQEVLAPLSPADIEALLAYLSIADD